LILYKSLLKSKPISTSPAFPAYIAAKVSQLAEAPDTATANVTARLFNSNPVKAELAAVLSNIHHDLGVTPDKVPPKKKRLRATDYNDKPSSVPKSQKAAPDTTSKATKREELAGECDSLPRSPQRSVSVEGEDASNSEGGSTDYDQYQSRLADSGSEDEVEELGSDSWEGVASNSTQEPQDNAPLPGDIEATPPPYHPSHSLSPSPSPSSSPSPPPPLRTHPPNPPPTTKQTTFLPSLISGYFSGSDSASAPSDTEPSAAPPRKNRRGQQERRAIWEKKFGSGAKHLQAGQQRAQNRDEGWDARRGASDGRGRGRGRGGMRGGMRGGGGRSRQQIVSGANEEMVSDKRTAGRRGAKRKQDEGPLHPSWEAKKKAKEKAAARGGAVAFLGKKIVFD